MTRQYGIHPLARLFPPLEGEAFAGLVADIEANGLRHPITFIRLGEKNFVVDGINRWRACRKANVDPSFVEFEGDESGIAGFIVSENLSRRHLTEGQKALLAVKLGKLPINQSEVARRVGVERKRISEAVRIIQADSSLADRVIAGEVPFSQAHRQVSPQSEPKAKPKSRRAQPKPATAPARQEANETTVGETLEVSTMDEAGETVRLGTTTMKRRSLPELVPAAVRTATPMEDEFMVRSIKAAKPRSAELIRSMGSVEPVLTRWVEDLRLGFVTVEDAEAVLVRFDRMAEPLRRHLEAVGGDWRHPAKGRP